MIADRDSAARNAFRVALLTAAPEETPLPVNTTQELDPGDILEVRDMAEAIARAEQIVAAPRSSRPSPRRSTPDLFDSLGLRPTDDASGPATPAPAALATAGLLLRPASTTPIPRPIVPARAMMLSLPATPPPPAPVAEDDAYFHPAGRIRSLADVTLDGYRPEPTLLLRARARRRSFTWVLGAALLPILVLAVISVLGRQETVAPSSTTTIATATIISTAAPSLPVTPVTPAVTATAAAPKPTIAPAKPVGMEARGTVPVFDVNSLPTAGARRTR